MRIGAGGDARSRRRTLASKSVSPVSSRKSSHMASPRTQQVARLSLTAKNGLKRQSTSSPIGGIAARKRSTRSTPKPETTVAREMPQRARASSWSWRTLRLPSTGSRHFGISAVRGSRRFPCPALSTMARMASPWGAPSSVCPGSSRRPRICAAGGGPQTIVHLAGQRPCGVSRAGFPRGQPVLLPKEIMSAAALTLPRVADRRPRLTLYRYVALEALRPIAFALFGLTLVVLTTRVLQYSDLVINRGVDARSVAAILFFEAVPVAARMLPFGFLVGSLVGLGRMA